MTEKLVTIKNRAGIHARPAALIVQTASKFASKIWLEKGNDKINAKSIMGIITLGASFGTPIRITAEGNDEEGAATAIEALFLSRFEEE
jgi:phosphocarrier protein